MTVLAHDWYPGVVPENVSLAPRSWLYSSIAFLHHSSEREPSVRIGPDSGVYLGSYFDLGPRGEVHVGSFCSIAGTIFSSNGRVGMGDYAFTAHGVVIADSFAALPPEPSGAARGRADRELSRDVIVGEGAWIGTRAVILGGTNLGVGVVVGAGAVVESEVPDYAIVAGNPARIVGWAQPQRGG